MWSAPLSSACLVDCVTNGFPPKYSYHCKKDLLCVMGKSNYHQNSNISSSFTSYDDIVWFVSDLFIVQH